MSESIHDIGKAIERHIQEENTYHNIPMGIARFRADIDSFPVIEQFYLTNVECKQCVQFHDSSMNIYKNSIFGGALIANQGKYFSYKAPKGIINVCVHDKATYRRTVSGIVEELEIKLADSNHIYRYATLRQLLNEYELAERKLEIEKQTELRAAQERERIRLEQEQAKLEEERLAAHAKLEADKSIREEQEELAARIRVLEEQRREQEEQERRNRETIERLEKEREDASRRIYDFQSFIRNEVSLRSQHILDPSQEDAKRSNIYDGVPVLIEGGPGTGKTTTTIQRLKFLLSREALDDYTTLSTKDKEFLTDDLRIRENWMFFSPNDMLLGYLRDNMQSENLNAGDKNTYTVDRFRKKMILEYKLRNPDTDGPFRLYTPAKGKTLLPLILNPQKVVKAFEAFCVRNIKIILSAAYELNTSEYTWHSVAVQIKSYCKKAENAKDLSQLMNVLNPLQDNMGKQVRDLEQTLGNILKEVAAKILTSIKEDDELCKKLTELLTKWAEEKVVIDEEVTETEMTEDEEESEISVNFEADLYQQLKKLLRAYAIRQKDSKKKLSARQNELLGYVQRFIENDDIENIGSYAWFVKNYAAITKGIESNVFAQIPRLYKLYRKSLIEQGTRDYNKVLLNELVSKDGNKIIHPDEQNLLIGFINSLLHRVYQRSNVRFEKLKHKYAIAYKEWCRPVIGIDEATDYTLLDYYFMYSFRHYKLSSVTLSGDIMQGLNEDGITSWEQLQKFVMPTLERKELLVSYRQLPTLLEVAREMYKDVEGHYPSYHSDKQQHENEPLPIAFVSEDEDKKIEWIAKRIIDVYNAYNKHLPSVAVFVDDSTDVRQFVESINDSEILNGIDVVDCSDGRTCTRKDVVRVFKIKEVKGMEFEVVFFHNLDEVINNHDDNILTKYLYVGVSRATTHLAATFLSEDAAGDVLKYFDYGKSNWTI